MDKATEAGCECEGPLHYTTCWWCVDNDDGRDQATGDPEIDWANTPRESISSGHYSVDGQLEDAVSWIEDNAPAEYTAFLVAFPGWPTRTMGECSSWFDTDAMKVDVEWSSWCIDWVEANTTVYWEDGEPWVPATDA